MEPLYKIAADYRAIADRLQESEQDEQTILDTLEGEAYPLEMKAQSVAYAVKEMEAQADAIDAAIKDMEARKKALKNRAENIRNYVLHCMTIAGVTKISCPHFDVKIVKNPASVEIFQPELIPAEFMRQPPPVADKKAIGDALKAGTDVQGARLVTDKNRLVIK